MHRMATNVASKPNVSKIFEYKPSSFLKTLQVSSEPFEFPWADNLTLKAFRAGRTTEMAKSGCSLGQILCAGEWRSAAFLCYVDEDAVDLSNAFGELYGSYVEK